MKRLFTFTCFGIFACTVFGQDVVLTEAQFDSIYARRITQTEINGVYIPKDLEDAFAELTRLSSPADLEKFKGATEEVVRTRLHFGLGKWMIVNWSFYEGSRLAHYFKNLGLLHPDDMARVILVSFHRKLNQRELKLQEEVAFYAGLREKEVLERESKKETISEEKRIRKD